jgi:hypothetical protein
MDCGGKSCVVGWDGVARAVPITEADLAQRVIDEEMQANKRDPTPQEKFDTLLRSIGLTKEELKAFING